MFKFSRLSTSRMLNGTTSQSNLGERGIVSIRGENCSILVSTHNLGSVPEFCDHVVMVNQTVLNHGPIETNFTHDHLKNAFGGVLRHLVIEGEDLHTDKDSRKVSILTDDERPLVTYGGKRQFARSRGLKND